jgi:hypothetical protein
MERITDMNTRQRREISLIKRTIVLTFLIALSLVGATAYNVLGGRELFETRSYSMSQLSADARTVAAALSYLLEPEPMGSDSVVQRDVG